MTGQRQCDWCQEAATSIHPVRGYAEQPLPDFDLLVHPVHPVRPAAVRVDEG